MSNQIVTYEPQHGGAAYIYLVGDIPPGGVKRTMQVSPDINLDFDAVGRLIGIELLNRTLLHPDLFARAIKPGMEGLTVVRAEDGSKPTHYGPEWDQNAEIDRLRAEVADLRDELMHVTSEVQTDFSELYQIVGVLAAKANVFFDLQVTKALDNILAAAEGNPRPHTDLLPFTPGDNT